MGLQRRLHHLSQCLLEHPVIVVHRAIKTVILSFLPCCTIGHRASRGRLLQPVASPSRPCKSVPQILDPSSPSSLALPFCDQQQNGTEHHAHDCGASAERIRQSRRSDNSYQIAGEAVVYQNPQGTCEGRGKLSTTGSCRVANLLTLAGSILQDRLGWYRLQSSGCVWTRRLRLHACAVDVQRRERLLVLGFSARGNCRRCHRAQPLCEHQR
jgi:hypothetical protein